MLLRNPLCLPVGFVILALSTGCNGPPSSTSDATAGSDGATADGASVDGSAPDAHLPADAPFDAPQPDPASDAMPADAALDATQPDAAFDAMPPDAAGPDAGCTPPATVCGSSCVSLDSDPEHCGSCGHDCLGTACMAGVCEPLVLGSLSPTLKGIAVDATHVYWVDVGDHSIYRRVKDASAPAETLVPSGTLYYPRAPAVDATHLYYVDFICCNFGGRVWRIAKAGGTPELLGMWGGSGGPAVNVAVDDAWVYVGALPIGELYAFPKTGGPYTLVTSDASHIQEVAVDATDAYFTAETVDGVMPAVVAKTPKGGGGPKTTLLTVPLPATPFAVVEVGDHVYVGSWNIMGGAGTGSLYRISKATGAVTVVAAGADVTDVVVDVTGAVWANNNPSTIWSVDHASTTPVVVAEGFYNVVAVAIDADSVYFATQPGPWPYGAQLLRMPR